MIHDFIGGIILLILCGLWSIYRTIKKPLEGRTRPRAEETTGT